MAIEQALIGGSRFRVVVLRDERTRIRKCARHARPIERELRELFARTCAIA
jgi:hypothetical protein